MKLSEKNKSSCRGFYFFLKYFQEVFDFLESYFSKYNPALNQRKAKNMKNFFYIEVETDRNKTIWPICYQPDSFLIISIF